MTRPRYSPKAPPPGRAPFIPVIDGMLDMPSSSRGSVVRRPINAVSARGMPVPTPQAGRRQLPAGPIALALVLVGIFATGLGLGQVAGLPFPDLFSGPGKPPPRAFPVLEPSMPVHVTIPSIKVDAPVHNVGLTRDGTVAVPTLRRHNEAGWFDRGPTPGQFGPAMLVGHADTKTGPSIFHDLGRLKPGATIEVTRRDRHVAVFEVNSVEHFGKSKLPVSRVYGDYSRPALRLVTCTGRWVGGSIGYSDNLVVFASLVAVRDT